MRRLPFRAAALVLIVAGLIALAAAVGRGGVAPTAEGQESSPAGSPVVPPATPPVIERVACGVLPERTAAGAEFFLNQVTFQPGEAIATESYSEPVLLYVASGSVELVVFDLDDGGSALLRTLAHRERAHDPWRCRTSEVIPLDTLITLNAGDAAYLVRADYQIQNPGEVEAVLWTTTIYPPGEAPAEATPVDPDDPETCLGGCPKWP